MTIARNAPCPCGSGKKYKRCCLGTETDPEPTETEPVSRAWKLPVAMITCSIAIGVSIGLWRGLRDGSAITMALLLLCLGWIAVQRAPARTGNIHGGGAIDFGKNQPRRKGQKNRAARRREP